MGQADTAGRDGHAPRVALVYNPVKVGGAQLRASVAAAADAAGWQPPIALETTPEDLGGGVTRKALEDGVDAVMVAGGDGTVRAVAEAVAGTGVPLTILPTGTGNLLARNLGLPLEKRSELIHATFDGETATIDIGIAAMRRADGSHAEHAFVVMGGMGLDATMIANTRPQLKKSVGWVAYVDGAARSLVTSRPFRLMYQVHGRRLHHTRVHSVVFANCGSLPAGIELIPEASITDGELDVALFQPHSPLGWLLVWRRVAWDNSVLRRFRAGRRILRYRTPDSAVLYARGPGIDLASDDPRPVELDGDEFGEAVHMSCRIEPGALRVTLPKGHRFLQHADAPLAVQANS